MAVDPQSLRPGHGPLLRRGQGRPPPRQLQLQGPHHRLRHRAPVPRSGTDPDPGGAGEWRRRAAPGVRRFGGILSEMTIMSTKKLLAQTTLGALAIAWLLSAPLASAAPKFYDDDPIAQEPADQDASAVEKWDVDLIIDLGANSFAKLGDKTENVRALDINTIDEVPDSDWFTNRILAKPMTIDEVATGPTVRHPAD